MSSNGCSVPAMLKKAIPALQDFADKCDESACATHDEAYERGGAAADRIAADYTLFLETRRLCGDSVASAVFDAVRSFGATHWGTGLPWHGGDAAWPEPPEAP